jgi:hypothetical protein
MVRILPHEIKYLLRLRSHTEPSLTPIVKITVFVLLVLLAMTEKFDGLISPNKHIIDQPHCNRNVTPRLFNNVAEKNVMVVSID